MSSTFAMSTIQTKVPAVSFLLALTVSARAGAPAAESRGFYFPPAGESIELQDRRPPGDVGLKAGVVQELRSRAGSGSWALWRHGHLVYVEGDFNRETEAKSLRKTCHALTVGAAIRQGKIPSVDQKISVWCKGLTGKHARATWRHAMAQTSGFDYPYGDQPAYEPGEIWTYSDKNPKHLCNALARVYGRKDYRDRYENVVRTAYFDAIGMRGWKSSVRQDGIRFHFDLEDLGRLGLLLVARGKWRDRELIAPSFIEQLESRQTRGAAVNYEGPDDGRVGLDPGRFPEAPYGFMTWVNTDGDYYPGAGRSWAWGAGAGGSYLLWNHENGIVFAGFGIDTGPTANGIPHVIEASLERGGIGSAGAPRPPSPVIRGITWHPESLESAAPGSDLWPVTWGPDGHIYTSWGDGGGFGGTNSDGRVSMGFARIEGPPEEYVAVNINGGKNARHPASFPRKGKTGGIVFVDGVLYAWLNRQDGSWPGVNQSLIWSNDRGATWKESSWQWPRGKGNFKPTTFLQFGSDYSAARDDFVYFYGRNETPWAKGTHSYLGRVPRGELRTRKAYQFFARLDAGGEPTWSLNVNDRKPHFTDPAGVEGVQVIYHAALKRYLLTSHRGSQGTLGIFDAPERPSRGDRGRRSPVTITGST
jgi:hypothetical protein